MISFLHSLYNGIFESSRGTHTAFCLLLLLGLCFAPCILWRKSNQAWERWNLGASWNYLLWNDKWADFEKCLRQTFAPDEKCSRLLKNVRAQPLRLMRNVCGLWKMFAPNLCTWWKMFATFEKCSRPTFALDEKCLRLLKNVRAQPLCLMRNVCGLWKNGAEKMKEKIRNQNWERTTTNSRGVEIKNRTKLSGHK